MEQTIWNEFNLFFVVVIVCVGKKKIAEIYFFNYVKIICILN